MIPKLLTVLMAAGFALVATAVAAAAQANPYGSTGTPGYDASSYQCSNAGATPTAYMFGIVRVTGGRPFSVDSCSQQLWMQAEKTTYPSLYENVAYSKAYAHQVPSSCTNATPVENYTGQYLQAWQIGCAESVFAFNNRPTDVKAAAVWWLDVETGNSWSTTNRGLNQAAIDGAVDSLLTLNASATVPVGVYSYANAWNQITTGSAFSPKNATGAWVAESGCIGSFSSGLPQWLYQSGSTSFGDTDTAC